MSDHEKLREAIKAARGQAYRSFTDPPGYQYIPLDARQATLLADAAESTLPKTKMVKVWRVECAQQSLGVSGGWTPLVCTYSSEAEANGSSHSHLQNGVWRCVSITGPHMQEVPA